MRTWPDTDGSTINRYLCQLRLRCPLSPIYYRQALRSFQDVVVRRKCPPSQINRNTLRAWLRERTKHWPMSTLLNRARIVNCFLDYLVQEGLIASNPVNSLREEYFVHSSQSIFRALLAKKPNQALEALRQYRPFGSVLGKLMKGHIELMQTKGFRYESETYWFLRFDRFLQSNPELAKEPVSVMLQHWAAARSTLNHAYECSRLARILAKAQRHLDPGFKMPRSDSRPKHQVEQQWRKPHIYSPNEVCLLLDIARAYPSPRAPLRPISLYTMLVLAMPTKKSVGGHNRADFLECLAAQYLSFNGQAAPLVISEQDAFLAELFFQYLVFSPQVLDNILLMAINPTRDNEEE
jgi:integrase/recombinase XerD